MQSDPAQGRRARGLREHQAQTEAGIKVKVKSKKAKVFYFLLLPFYFRTK
jgi:hypothetical protein